MAGDARRDSDDMLELADAMLTAHGRLRRALVADDTDGLSMSQLVVLSRLVRNGATTTADLARAEGVRPQSLGQTVQALHEHGFVERSQDPDDGRRTLIRATDLGATAHRASRRGRLSFLTERLAALGPDDRATVARAVEIVASFTES